MRAPTLLVLLLTAGAATAAPRTAEQAEKANAAAFERALAKAGLKAVSLPETPAAKGDATEADHLVLELVTTWGREEVLFAVDAKRKTVVRVKRKAQRVGRVQRFVCHAGPMRREITRVRFALPEGHAWGGERVVRYPAYEINDQNTCR